MLLVQTESRWSIGCCHDRMWSIAMFAPGRGFFWALVICPRLDCWRIARFKLDSCKLTWLPVGFIHLQSPNRCWDLVVGNLGNSANQEEPVLLWEIDRFLLKAPKIWDLSQESYVTQVSLMPKYKSKQSLALGWQIWVDMLPNLQHGLANQHGHQQKLLSERNIFLEGLTLYRGPAIPGLECFPIFPSAVRRYGISWDSKQWLPFFLLETGMACRYALSYVATSKMRISIFQVNGGPINLATCSPERHLDSTFSILSESGYLGPRPRKPQQVGVTNMFEILWIYFDFPSKDLLNPSLVYISRDGLRCFPRRKR